MTKVTITLTPEQFDTVRAIIKRDLQECEEDWAENFDTFSQETRVAMSRRKLQDEELLRVLS